MIWLLELVRSGSRRRLGDLLGDLLWRLGRGDTGRSIASWIGSKWVCRGREGGGTLGLVTESFGPVEAFTATRSSNATLLYVSQSLGSKTHSSSKGRGGGWDEGGICVVLLYDGGLVAEAVSELGRTGAG